MSRTPLKGDYGAAVMTFQKLYDEASTRTVIVENLFSAYSYEVKDQPFYSDKYTEMMEIWANIGKNKKVIKNEIIKCNCHRCSHYQ